LQPRFFFNRACRPLLSGIGEPDQPADETNELNPNQPISVENVAHVFATVPASNESHLCRRPDHKESGRHPSALLATESGVDGFDMFNEDKGIKVFLALQLLHVKQMVPNLLDGSRE
jgi:hypothetical protein